MAYLEINGIPVPVAAGSLEIGYDEIGTQRRAFSGQLRGFRRVRKRLIRARTVPLPPHEAKPLRALIGGEGHVWDFDRWLLSGSGIAPTAPDATETWYGLWTGTNLVATHRKREGVYGGGAVAVESGTTNLLINPSFETDTDSDGVPDGWTFNAMDIDTGAFTKTLVDSPFGGKAWHIKAENIPSSAITGPSPRVHIYQDYSAAPNTTYTFSLYIKCSRADTSIVIELRDDWNTLASQTIVSAGATTEWKRVQLTVTTPSTFTGPLRATITLSGPIQPGYNYALWLDHAQLEARNSATSFVDGTRSTGTLRYPLPFTDWSRATLIVRFNPQKRQPATWSQLITVAYSGGPIISNRIGIYYGSGWGIDRAGYQAWTDTQFILSRQIIGIDQDDTWYLAAMRFQETQVDCFLFKGATRQGTTSFVLDRPLVFGDDDLLEWWSDNHNCLIDFIAMLPYPLDDDQIASVAAAARPFYAPQLHVAGDAISGEMIAEGRITSARAVPIAKDGVYYPDAEQIEFELLEV